MAIAPGSYSFMGGAVLGKGSEGQFVLVRSGSLLTAFTDDEYNACLEAVHDGKAVCVQYKIGPVTFQTQLLNVTGLGNLQFVDTTVQYVTHYRVAGTSPHTVSIVKTGSAQQFVLERDDMSTAFTASEYIQCQSRVSEGSAVCVQWKSGSDRMQAQLSAMLADGAMLFSFTSVDLETIFIVSGSDPHNITAHTNSLGGDLKSLKLKNPRYNNADEVFEYNPFDGLDVRFKMLNFILGDKQSQVQRYTPILGTGESSETIDLTDAKLGMCCAYRELSDTASSDRYVKIATLEFTPDKNYYYCYNLDLALSVTNTSGSGGPSESGIFHLAYYVDRAVNLYYDEGSWLSYDCGDNGNDKQILGIKVLRQFEEVSQYSDGKPCIKVEVHVHLSSNFNAGPSFLAVHAINNVGMKYYKTNYSSAQLMRVPFDFSTGMLKAMTTAPSGDSTAPYSYTVEDFPTDIINSVVFKSDIIPQGGLYNSIRNNLNHGKTVIFEYGGSQNVPRCTAMYIGKDQYDSFLFATPIIGNRWYVFDIDTSNIVGTSIEYMPVAGAVGYRYYQNNFYDADNNQVTFARMMTDSDNGTKPIYFEFGTSAKDIYTCIGFGQNGVNQWLKFQCKDTVWFVYDDMTIKIVGPVRVSFYQTTPSDDTTFVMSGATFDELVDAFKNDIPIYATVKRGNATDPISYKPFNFVLTTTGGGEPSHFYFYLLTHQSSPSIRRIQVSPDDSVAWQLS